MDFSSLGGSFLLRLAMVMGDMGDGHRSQGELESNGFFFQRFSAGLSIGVDTLNALEPWSLDT
jgi:hypothetical protein